MKRLRLLIEYVVVFIVVTFVIKTVNKSPFDFKTDIIDNKYFRISILTYIVCSIIFSIVVDIIRKKKGKTINK